MSDRIINLNPKDVISFESGIIKVSNFEEVMFRESVLKDISRCFNNEVPSHILILSGNSNQYKWCGEGVVCEVLKPGAPDWQTGKLYLRISLEFVPDSMEVEILNQESNDLSDQKQTTFPLDDLRQTLVD